MDLLKSLLKSVQNFRDEVDPEFFPVKTAPTNQYGRYDVVVVTASIDEYRTFSKYVQRTEIKEYSKDPTLYLRGLIDNELSKPVSIIMPIPSEMGVASASINTTKAIINFSPSYVFMVGICAGIKGVTSLGDIVLAEKTLDYNEVVEIQNSDNTVRTKFMNNVISITSTMKTRCHLFMAKHKANNTDLKEKFGVTYQPRCHFGLLATGSALLRNGERVNQLARDYHNVKAIDMETYGVYKAVDSFENKNGQIQFLSVKAVSDFADNEKLKSNESQIDRRGLALHNASFFLYELIRGLR